MNMIQGVNHTKVRFVECNVQLTRACFAGEDIQHSNSDQYCQAADNNISQLNNDDIMLVVDASNEETIHGSTLPMEPTDSIIDNAIIDEHISTPNATVDKEALLDSIAESDEETFAELAQTEDTPATMEWEESMPEEDLLESNGASDDEQWADEALFADQKWESEEGWYSATSAKFSPIFAEYYGDDDGDHDDGGDDGDDQNHNNLEQEKAAEHGKWYTSKDSLMPSS